jgi:hypothetical protein
MSQYKLIKSDTNKNSGYLKKRDYFFAQNDHFVPIVTEELAQIATNLPLCFIQDENGKFILGVMQSLIEDKNFLVHPSGKWFTGYVPAHYRAYPFALFNSDSGESILGIDLASGLFKENTTADTTRFFTDTGEYEDFIKKLLHFLELKDKGLQKTQNAVDTIASVGILTPWEISIVEESGEKRKFKGMYRIDEAKLNDLLPAEFLKLRGVLSVIYTVLLSEHKLSNLTKLYNLHKKFEKEEAPKQEEFDLDKFFAEQNDTLRF